MLIFFLLFLLQAKQRASIKWLLSKAYDHRTPDELKEPFYKDHDVSLLTCYYMYSSYYTYYCYFYSTFDDSRPQIFSGRSYKIAISNVKVNEILEYLARIDYPLISETFVFEDLIRWKTFFPIKVQVFSEGHKNLNNLPLV